MSGLTEQFSGANEDKSVLDLVREHYHVPLLALAVMFSLWVRTRGWENFVRGDRVLFSGNDAWYHLRMVRYTVNNWPFTMPFDPWTHYPVGTEVGQFGTLYDQIVATVALIVGLGSPTETQVAMTHLFAPAVFGALALIPAYYLAKHISDRTGGLVAVLLLALSTGQFLTRGLVGFSDHHIAEVFFFTLAAFAVTVALTLAEAEKPGYELAVAREWDALRRPVLWSALAGVLLTLYLWTWPPGIFVVGILGVFFAVAMSYKQAVGTSPDHLATVGVIVGVVVGLLTLLTIDTFTVDAVKLSLLQPALGFGLAAGCAFLAGLARQWDDRHFPATYYPVAVLGIAVTAAGLLALVAPELFDYMVGQVLRIFGYDATAASRTVAEAQPIPLGQAGAFFSASYGLAIYTALGGFAFMTYKVIIADDARADHILVLILTVFLLMATLTQRRFDYYLAIPVAILNGYLAMVVFRLVDLDDVIDSVDDIKAYQVMAVVAVLMLVAAPLAVGAQTAPSVAERSSNPGEVTQWTGSLDWMQENTPPMGTYGNGTANQSLEYYGKYKPTDDFEYDDGSYGTLAWWDYGHWITVLGQRVPNANPFQQGATEAANVLLAPNESTATELNRVGDGQGTRYIVVDYQLGVASTRKFVAPTAFENRYGLSDTDADTSNDVTKTIYNRQSGQRQMTLHSPRSYDSLRVRLYQFHGSRTSPQQFQGPVYVVDYDTETIQGRTYNLAPQNENLVKTFQNVSAAQEYVDQEGTAQIGGFPGYPSKTVEALEHYRLVHASNSSSPQQVLGQRYPYVKTFERVPGATVTGQAEPNSTVTASVPMRMTGPNKTFVYRQQAQTGPDGTFTMTLPYSTTGYEQWGTEKGYTNVSTRADGPYRFSTQPTVTDDGTIVRYTGSSHVAEGNVIGENETNITVELQQDEIQMNQGNQSNASANETAANETISQSDGPAGGSNESDGTNDTSASFARPTTAARAR